MSFEHNAGPPTSDDLRRTRNKGWFRRLFDRSDRGFSSWWIDRTTLTRPGMRSRLRRAFGLNRPEPDKDTGLPEAELTAEQRKEAQEEYQRKYPEP